MRYGDYGEELCRKLYVVCILWLNVSRGSCSSVGYGGFIGVDVSVVDMYCGFFGVVCV